MYSLKIWLFWYFLSIGARMGIGSYVPRSSAQFSYNHRYLNTVHLRFCHPQQNETISRAKNQRENKINARRGIAPSKKQSGKGKQQAVQTTKMQPGVRYCLLTIGRTE